MYERRGRETPKEAHNKILEEIGRDLGKMFFDLAQENNLTADNVQALVGSLSEEGGVSVTDICDGFKQRSEKLEKDAKNLEKLQQIQKVFNS